MIVQNISLLHLFYIRGSEKLLMGRLALKDQNIFFEYAPDFLKTGLELSPFKLPLKPGVFVSPDSLFEGLFGVFNDSLPDGWGKLLLDRKLLSLGINPGDLSPLDRLRYVGNQGMGALIYEPEIEGICHFSHKDLDTIADETLSFQEKDEDQFVDELLIMNGSSAGARPKIVVDIDGENWMIKFRSSLDPKDMGPIEYAYHLMARASHLDVPRAKLFTSKKGPGYFGVQRFDRKEGKRLHMHTVSGLLHVDHRLACLDYETIMKATLWLSKNVQECEKQFKAAVFNILAHNRDDHAKNFSFLMNENGMWYTAPAYDLIFSSGPAGEHCTMVIGEGKNPTLSHLLKLSTIGGLKKQKALEIIDEVRSAVAGWTSFAEEAGVTRTSSNRIANTLDRVTQIVFA